MKKKIRKIDVLVYVLISSSILLIILADYSCWASGFAYGARVLAGRGWE